MLIRALNTNVLQKTQNTFVSTEKNDSTSTFT